MALHRPRPRALQRRARAENQPCPPSATARQVTAAHSAGAILRASLGQPRTVLLGRRLRWFRRARGRHERRSACSASVSLDEDVGPDVACTLALDADVGNNLIDLAIDVDAHRARRKRSAMVGLGQPCSCPATRRQQPRRPPLPAARPSLGAEAL